MLVLMPGTQGGAGDFTLVARGPDQARRRSQVWAIDRRSQALEDTAMFARAIAGEVTLQEMFDYYLGWIGNGGSPGRPLRLPRRRHRAVRPRMGHGGRARRTPARWSALRARVGAR